MDALQAMETGHKSFMAFSGRIKRVVGGSGHNGGGWKRHSSQHLLQKPAVAAIHNDVSIVWMPYSPRRQFSFDMNQ
jgi:hypothetical protein